MTKRCILKEYYEILNGSPPSIGILRGFYLVDADLFTEMHFYSRNKAMFQERSEL